MPTTVIENVRIGGHHRYGKGKALRHRDTPINERNRMIVTALTYTVAFNGDGEPFAYPTYTLEGYDGETVTGVLCTTDLVGYYEAVSA